MRLVRITALLLICGAGLSYPAASQKQDKPAGKQVAAEEEQVPKSIAESVAAPLQFAEGSFLGVLKPCRRTYMQLFRRTASSKACAASASR